MHKIIVLVPGNERGGAATHIATFARTTLGDLNIQFYIVGTGSLQEKLQSLGASLVLLPSNPLQAMRALRSHVKSIEGSVLIHAHGPRMNVIACIVAGLTRGQWVSTIHSDVHNDFLASGWKTMLFTRLNVRCLRRAVGLFVGNPNFANEFPSKNWTYVPNGIDLQPLPQDRNHYRQQMLDDLHLSADVRFVGIAARLDPVKDIPTILHAMARINDEHIHLLIAGDGTERQALEELRDQLHLQHRVHFLGFLSSIAPFYAALDAHVMASVSESSTPYFLLEAGFFGTPNIATNIAGVRDLLDLTTARLFQPGDAGALASHIVELTSQDGVGAQLADNFARVILPRFSPSAMNEAYMYGYAKFT